MDKTNGVVYTVNEKSYKIADKIAKLLNKLRNNSLSSYISIFKEVGDSVCTESNGVYLRKQDLTSEDMRILHTHLNTSIRTWRQDKIQYNKQHQTVIQEINTLVSNIETIYKTLDYTFVFDNVQGENGEYKKAYIKDLLYRLENECMTST
jgi:hypothetical protein